MQNRLFLGILTLSLFSLQSIQVHAIELQPHQKLSVDYLTNHPEHKGILLFHSLGSGKTYIALDYIEKNPTKKVVLFLPSFLKSGWLQQMRSFGVKNTARYHMISFHDAEEILSCDLSNTILVIDEAHQLIKTIKTSLGKRSNILAQVYEKVKTASKILLLTGTPVSSTIVDVAYLANLFYPDNPYPLDSNIFKNEYMDIIAPTSLVRGHLLESKAFQATLPPLFSFGSFALTTNPVLILLAGSLGGSVLPLVNKIFNTNQTRFRKFATEKWKDFAEKYISYYKVAFTEDKNYPKKNITEKEVRYNDHQLTLFLNMTDLSLTTEEIKLFLDDDENYPEAYLQFHSEKLQKKLINSLEAGLEIGNLDFQDEDGNHIESPKFLEILKMIQNKPGQVAVYSNRFRNGINRFAHFLRRHGLGNSYVMLTPDQTIEEQIQGLTLYNTGQKRIVLIHPTITEGISLMGTEQFHILEPLSSSWVQNQIVGRAIRYRSHEHLPKNRRKVNVYLWKTTVKYYILNFFNTRAGVIRREHWQKNYSEVSPDGWGEGILGINPNYHLQEETPDERHTRISAATEKDFMSFQDLLDKHCIEKSVATH